MHNTAKFTRSGSITVSAGTEGSAVFISVADTGLGIPRDKFQQIFGAFEQVDTGTTRRYGGTGLGLHLVKQLVEAHSGEDDSLAHSIFIPLLNTNNRVNTARNCVTGPHHYLVTIIT